ncbi:MULTISPECIES: bifunctional 3,4-dihydroxy-2-butanone-4-phosphate synthase/GTP cyclohydrolase II [Methylococcus]|jgi:3,4-dihydroxy 2-butanone 4-phosphate synthase/GTP cyclohydrolase II|uniref:Riboflavin biosynthesis protein RibBA n=1 Tax=Methylococcus capsulatus TaxID=414 RepID=A0AA35URB6_METCP|nr:MULTISPECIES: bifunctional 3,4-dihydroxy-2-butanone-4-phosphate synthase/GTP cyclohydrolase II [Methylococcus]UZR29544.1 bifunctional 3,4-dihydroxy-2-butanone-4-phosphate synthase/GTP cyclohydrolase II [Methylococcus mesophilus]CAI8839199.1 3,4-dihydroxy-2-butanone 4-phosphate synthase / GTP cyclohydrolase-2 [Methylococcus capsulatus]
MTYDTIETALTAIRNGGFVVVADDASRENEGDLILAAEKMTPERMAFLVRHTSGLVCVGLAPERVEALQLPPMVGNNSDPFRTAFTVSVDLAQGTSTGISAADRSATIRALADPEAGPAAFARPGHVFPLKAKPNGVLERPGHTEAAVDLARLAGLAPAGALCEIVNDDGRMVRGPELVAFARRHWLPVIRIADLIAYRRRTERLVEHVAEARLPTPYGTFTAHVYRSVVDGSEHLALVKGWVYGRENVLVRVHSECLTGDILGSLRCDCGNQLKMALEAIEQAGNGVLVYLRGHEGRGIGLAHKLKAYQLQDRGRDTVEANLDLGLPVDARSYDVGAQILTDLGVTTLRLMSNNPAKFTELAGYRLKIVERVPLEPAPHPENLVYLRTKSQKLGHLLNLDALAGAGDEWIHPSVGG